MMDTHARTLDDALANLKRSLEARPGDFGPSDRPSGGQGHVTRNQAGARSPNGINANGKNTRSNRHSDRVVADHLQARRSIEVFRFVMWGAVAVSVGIAGFRLLDEARQRHDRQQPTLTRLLFAPPALGDRGL